MKHALLLALGLLLFGSVAEAQSANTAIWCPPGATWTYSYSEMSGAGTLAVRYMRDTVVAGQPAQLLVRRISPCFYYGGNCYPSPAYNISSVITRVANDRVEVQANGQFYTLYDFAALPGGTWLTPMVTPVGPCASGLAQVMVDSVGRQMVGGRSLRWFRAHLTPAAGATAVGSWPGRIYEQLGNVNQYMQPQSPICHGTDPGYMGAMQTYQATGGPWVRYNGTALLATAESRAAAARFVAFPNPSTGLLTLELPTRLSPEAHLSLFDLTGRPVRQLPVARQLDVRGLAPGTYTLLLQEPGQPPLAQRVLLQ
jgi:hypothetical protein